MTLDAVSTQLRCVAERHPTSELMGNPSDYAKAYKQIPAYPPEVTRYVLAQWNPWVAAVAFWVALSLLFGGRLAPIGFARHPTWMTYVLAVLKTC